DAEDERPSGPSSPQPVEERGAHPTDVEVSGGGGGKADADGARHAEEAVTTPCRRRAASARRLAHLSPHGSTRANRLWSLRSGGRPHPEIEEHRHGEEPPRARQGALRREEEAGRGRAGLRERRPVG